VQSDYAWPTMLFGALTALSIVVDWLRHRSRDERRGKADIFGYIPWPLIALLALLLTAYFGALWLKEG
jgi:Na+/proline symporter